MKPKNKQPENINHRAGRKIRKGDKVYVISGNERGHSGVVLSRHGERVKIQGLNMCKKHVKKSQVNPKGDIITIEAALHVSNVKLYVEGRENV